MCLFTLCNSRLLVYLHARDIVLTNKPVLQIGEHSTGTKSQQKKEFGNVEIKTAEKKII